MTNLESRIKGRLTEKSMTIQRLALESGISEPTIHAIFNRGDAKISQLEKIARALTVPLNFLLLDEFQAVITKTTDFNSSDSAHAQEIEVTQSVYYRTASDLAITKNALETTRELMAGQTQIITSLRDQLKAKDALIDAQKALIASREETIDLLKAKASK